MFHDAASTSVITAGSTGCQRRRLSASTAIGRAMNRSRTMFSPIPVGMRKNVVHAIAYTMKKLRKTLAAGTRQVKTAPSAQNARLAPSSGNENGNRPPSGKSRQSTTPRPARAITVAVRTPRRGRADTAAAMRISATSPNASGLAANVSAMRIVKTIGWPRAARSASRPIERPRAYGNAPLSTDAAATNANARAGQGPAVGHSTRTSVVNAAAASAAVATGEQLDPDHRRDGIVEKAVGDVAVVARVPVVAPEGEAVLDEHRPLIDVRGEVGPRGAEPREGGRACGRGCGAPERLVTEVDFHAGWLRRDGHMPPSRPAERGESRHDGGMDTVQLVRLRLG